MGDLKRLVRETVWLFTDEYPEIEIEGEVISLKLSKEESLAYFKTKGAAVLRNLKLFIESCFNKQNIEIKVLKNV